MAGGAMISGRSCQNHGHPADQTGGYLLILIAEQGTVFTTPFKQVPEMAGVYQIRLILSRD